MKIQNMHELFLDVLNKRDLSRAGDLFQIEDRLIVTDLSQLINQIEKISSAHDFNQKFNDQSVIEICLTRITSAIRDTGTIEKHSKALVSLLESCLQHDLKPSKKDEDPPHAKIASDVVSCIFLNHGKKSVMQMAVPIAVKLLHRGNKELSRNLSSYLSLAAINNADILAPHIQLIIDSIIGGNYTLTRVLPKIYPVRKEPIHDHVMALVCLLPQCETPEKLSLLNLFALISKIQPNLLESNLPEFSECLAQPQTAYPTLQIFLNIAQVNAKPFLEYVNKVVNACSLQTGMLSIAVQFLSIIGKLNIDRACDCLCFLTSQLSKSDLSTTITILKEIKSIVEVFPSILPNFFKEILMQTENSTSSTVQNYLHQLNNIDQQVNCCTTIKVNCDQFNPYLSSYSTNYSSNSYNTNNTLFSIYDSNNIAPKNSNYKLNSNNLKFNYNSSNYKLSSNGNISSQNYKTNGNYNNFKQANNIRTISNNESFFHRSIPKLHLTISNNKISKQITSLTNSLTNCSKHFHLDQQSHQINNQHLMHQNNNHHSHNHHQKQKSVSSSYLLALQEKDTINCSEDSILTNNANNHSLVHNPSPSSSSNQNILCFRNSRPEMTMMNVNFNQANNFNSLLYNSERNNYTPGIYSFNSSKALLASSNLNPTVHNTSTILDNPQLLQLSSSSSFTNATNQNNFLTYSLNGKNFGFKNSNYNYEYRDGIKHFCEKHLDKIKSYMEKIFVQIPLPVKITIEERKSKKVAKLHFFCQVKDCHCLFNKTYFTMKTRNARFWIHLMFLELQSRADVPLFTSEPAVVELKSCWDTLNDTYKPENIHNNNKSFLALVTSSFPSVKDQEMLILELRNKRYFDVFEFNGLCKSWSCFMCNHPDKVTEYIEKDPVIQGQLKEKRAKWKIFRRWHTRYFTLSGLSLSYRDKNSKNTDTVEIGEVRSVKAIGSSRGRNIPKAFEIFTKEHKTYLLKAKNSKYTSEWVQCLSIAMAHSQAKESN